MSTEVTTETPLRFAVLGAADIAWRRMLPAMAGVPQTRAVVVASRRAQEAARFAEHFDTAAVTGYGETLSRDDVDAVYLPLPNALHAEWVERALEAGKHVLVEKPLSTDHQTTARLQRLARSRGLVLMESMMFVHHRQHDVVRRLLTAGQVGEVRTFSAAFVVPPRTAGDIRYQAGLGGGALLDTGMYPIRAAQHLLGPDLEVLGAVLRYDERHGVDVSGTALLTTPAGVSVHLDFGLDQGYRCGYEVSGTAGRVVLDRAFTPPADHRPVIRWSGSDGQSDELPLTADDQFANLLRHFVTAVRTGAGGDHAEASLAQAELVDRIRDVARRFSV